MIISHKIIIVVKNHGVKSTASDDQGKAKYSVRLTVDDRCDKYKVLHIKVRQKIHKEG